MFLKIRLIACLTRCDNRFEIKIDKTFLKNEHSIVLNEFVTLHGHSEAHIRSWTMVDFRGRLRNFVQRWSWFQIKRNPVFISE